MCRLFAVVADRPVNAGPALATAPHALKRQSCGDLSGECHTSGWGLAEYVNSQPVRVRSTHSAADDPQFLASARDYNSTVILGHIRQASVGGVREANTHPFIYGPMLFAHNGTVEGFAGNPGPLWDLIPEHLRGQIEGETDSEHLFFALLGRIQSMDGKHEEDLDRAVGEFLNEIVQLYPGTADEPTRLNIVLTDGRRFLATRWKHTLYLAPLTRPDAAGVVAADGSSAILKGLAIASEPVTSSGWHECPDRSIIVALTDGHYRLSPI